MKLALLGVLLVVFLGCMEAKIGKKGCTDRPKHTAYCKRKANLNSCRMHSIRKYCPATCAPICGKNCAFLKDRDSKKVQTADEFCNGPVKPEEPPTCADRPEAQEKCAALRASSQRSRDKCGNYEYGPYCPATCGELCGKTCEYFKSYNWKFSGKPECQSPAQCADQEGEEERCRKLRAAPTECKRRENARACPATCGQVCGQGCEYFRDFNWATKLPVQCTPVQPGCGDNAEMKYRCEAIMSADSKTKIKVCKKQKNVEVCPATCAKICGNTCEYFRDFQWGGRKVIQCAVRGDKAEDCRDTAEKKTTCGNIGSSALRGNLCSWGGSGKDCPATCAKVCGKTCEYFKDFNWSGGGTPECIAQGVPGVRG